jgi:hypothetical protein
MDATVGDLGSCELLVHAASEARTEGGSFDCWRGEFQLDEAAVVGGRDLSNTYYY